LVKLTHLRCLAIFLRIFQFTHHLLACSNSMFGKSSLRRSANPALKSS
jgi:hypothetical protein